MTTLQWILWILNKGFIIIIIIITIIIIYITTNIIINGITSFSCLKPVKQPCDTLVRCFELK